MAVESQPRLRAVERAGVRLFADPAAAAQGVLVAFTGRAGGVSASPYDTLNLGTHVGDDPAAVAENRRRVAAALGVAGDGLCFLRQVHGTDVVQARPGDRGELGEGDVIVARSAGPAIAVLTADCAPVIVAGDAGVAIAHAGWRGLVAGAVEAAVAAVAPARAAWVGPCIRGCCYRVGPEVVAAFEEAGLPVAGPDRVDVHDAALAALAAAGVEQRAGSGICTHDDRNYFSYRRDGRTGRQGAFAALLG